MHAVGIMVYAADMSPGLKRSSVLQHFECGNMIEIHNEIMFDFYIPGTPTLYVILYLIICVCLHGF